MKRAIFTFICVVAALSTGQSAPKEKTSNTKPDAGGVVIEPSEGKIAPGDELTITFPSAMVSADKINMGEQSCPFVSQPKLEGTFLWKSETEGVFTVTGAVAGARHRLTLAPGLKEATGEPIVAKDWSAEFTAPEFSVTSDFSEREHLDAQPQIALDCTYDVRLAEVAEHVYFQNRDSRQRFPAEVILWPQSKVSKELEAKEFKLAPRDPLPVGHTYDLIVNGLLDAKSRKPLPYLKVLPAGKTEPLKVEWVGAFNHPLEAPSIRIKFTDNIAPAEATPEKIHVDPAVKEMKLLASGDEIRIIGEFDLGQRYKATVSPELKGERGYERAVHRFPGLADFSAGATGTAIFIFPNQYPGGDMEARAHSAGEIADDHGASARFRKRRDRPGDGESHYRSTHWFQKTVPNRIAR